MKRVKLKRRAFVVLVAALVLSANTLSAQGGLFKRGAVAEENGYGYSSHSQNDLLGRSGGTEGIINNQTFGQDVPLGSSLVLLMAAGAGYALLKRKEDEQ